MFDILRDNFTIDEFKLILYSIELLISLSVPVLLYFITAQLGRKNKIEEQLNEPKRKASEELLTLLTDVIHFTRQHSNKQIQNDQ